MHYIVDSHCHIDLIEEKGISFQEIIENCHMNNVGILQTICTRISNINKILEYTKSHNFIYSSIGNHPCNVASEKMISIQEVIDLCKKEDKIIGIGETGLDYYHDTSSIEIQKESFLKHINVSYETQLPLIIHNRNSDEDMIDILKNEKRNYNFPALLHCFSSSKKLAYEAIDLGIFISISGIVTFKNAQELQEIVKDIPLEMILVETDSPYLSPSPHRGQINQPSLIKHTVDFIAKLKNLDPLVVTEVTTKNFHKLFKKAYVK